jgi:photosystem II stability/assembly factor-like uncharacterized protein
MDTYKKFLVFILFCCCTAISPLAAQTWERQESPTNTHFSSIQFIDENTGWACGNAGRILKTTNKGALWFQVSTVGLDLADLHFVDANTGWVAGLGGVIFRTVDGGVSWNLQSVGSTGWLNCIFMWDASTGWAAGLYGTILATTNGGASWAPQTSGTASTIENVCFISATKGWMATNDGKILRTENGGATWTQQPINPPTTLNAVCFTSASVGWAAGGGGRISKSTDGGSTWVDQTSGTTQQLNEVAFVNADTGWAAGNGGTILRTTNGGATWSSQISTTTENLQSIQFLNTSSGHAVGLNSIILEYATIHSVPIQLASFTAALVGNNAVRLNWTTISEINNYGFEIQRAIGNPSGFLTLTGSFIPGHGTTNEPQHYTFTDHNVPSGRLYYRLKQIDLDGTINYTEPISIDIVTGVDDEILPTKFALKQNYPNPFNPSTIIEFSVPCAGFVSLKVYDLLGREVATIINEEMSQGTYTKTFYGENLSSGVYWYRLTAGTSSETKKLILSK